MEYKINYDKLNCTELHAAHILKLINDNIILREKEADKITDEIRAGQMQYCKGMRSGAIIIADIRRYITIARKIREKYFTDNEDRDRIFYLEQHIYGLSMLVDFFK